MAITVDDQANSVSESADNVQRLRTSVRRRRKGGLIVWTFLFVGLVSGGVSLFPHVSERLSSGDDDRGVLTYTVSRSDLLITVTENGNVESSSNVEVKCQVAGGSTILWIVPDGEQVKKDQLIIKLDKSQLEEQLNSQTITMEKALASKIQVVEDYAASKLAVREYEEGTFIEQLKDGEAQIRIALQNLRSAENIYNYTKRMARKGFATSLQREADKNAVERAQLELDKVETAKKVLLKFTKEKTLKDLVAKREATAAKVRSEEAAFNLEWARLERLKKHLKFCEIKAPQNGMVVYANNAGRSRFGGQNQVQIEEGAMVRERQTLIRLPDLSNMQVKVSVHESMVDQVQRNMPARIVIGDEEFKGKVVSVANQPESTSWFSANVKEYATLVAIEGETERLKPGMSADVEILIADIKDVLTVPVSVVVEQAGEYFCWVKTDDGPSSRLLNLGQSNDQLIEVIDGVKEGNVVLRNPRAVVEEARQENSLDDRKKDRFQFGEPSTENGETSSGTKDDQENSPQPDASQRRSEVEIEVRAAESGSRRPGQGRSGHGTFDILQYDQDGDKKVSQDEVPEAMQRFFNRLDENGDGFIDEKEIAGMRSRFGSGSSRRGAGSRSLMQYDNDGDKKVSRDEAPEWMQRLFERWDTSGDGFIDESEISAIRSQSGSDGGGGQPGGGGFGGPRQ